LIRTGPVADIHAIERVGYDVAGSFRELMVHSMDTVPHTVNVVTAGNPPGQPIEVNPPIGFHLSSWSQQIPFAQCRSPHLTMARHPGPIREQWARQTFSQDEHMHGGQRSPGIDPFTSSLVLCYSVKKAF